MRIWDLLKIANRNLFRNKLRTFLTVAAIFIGSFTLTMTNGLGDGMRSYVESQVKNIESDTVLFVRRKIDPAGVPGLIQGRIFSGRQALDSKLIDAIGGEREAVAWLETTRGLPKGLSIVDWKPRAENQWGLMGAIGPVVGLVLGRSSGEWVGQLIESGSLSRLPLDGLVSVWHVGRN